VTKGKKPQAADHKHQECTPKPSNTPIRKTTDNIYGSFKESLTHFIHAVLKILR